MKKTILLFNLFLLAFNSLLAQNDVYGTYYGKEQCAEYLQDTDGYWYNIEILTDDEKTYINNFWGKNWKIEIIIKENNFTIPSQKIDSYMISGKGKFNPKDKSFLNPKEYIDWLKENDKEEYDRLMKQRHIFHTLKLEYKIELDLSDFGKENKVFNCNSEFEQK